MIRRLCCFLLSFLVVFGENNASVNDPNYRFHNLTTDDGLPSSVVFDIVQDQKGFIWFGTSGGLARFDGIEFKIQNNDLRTLFIDNDGDIWYGNHTSPVEYFSPITNTKVVPDKMVAEIRCGIQAKDKRVYVISSKGEVFVINKHNRSWQKIIDFKSYLGEITDGGFEAPDGSIWFPFGYLGLIQINPANYHYKLYRLPNMMSGDRTEYAGSLFKDRDGKVWVGGFHLWEFDLKTFKYHYNANANALLSHENRIMGIKQDIQNRIWFGGVGGLFCHDPCNGKTLKFYPDQKLSYALNSKNITTLFVDNSNVLWIGTIESGVFKIDLSAKKFNVLQRNAEKYFAGANKYISGVAVDKEDNVWFYGGDPSVYVWNRRKNTFKKFTNNEARGRNFHFKSEFGTMTVDEQGNLWIAPWLWTLHKVRYQNGTATVTQYRTENVVSDDIPGGWSYRQLLVSKRGGMYISYADAGVDYFDFKTQKFTHYKDALRISDSHLKLYFWSLYEDKNMKLWAGHSENGFDIIDPKDGSVVNYKLPVKDNQEIFEMKEASDGYLYIGASDGIFVYDPENVTFVKHISVHDGLPNKNVRTIQEDRHKNLWIGTDKGLAKYNLVTGTINTYSKFDGLPGNEFFVGGSAVSKSGEMFFGTNKGLLYFHPDSIQNNVAQSEVVLTELRLMQRSIKAGDTINDRVILEKDIAYTSEIHLKHTEKAFTLAFTAIHYANPLANKFQYKLEGWDKEWIFTDAKHRYATYTNLPHGKYIFKLKSSNRDNIWNEKPLELTIYIHPPFWNTFWFKIACILCIIFGAYAYYHYRTYSLNQQKKLLKQRVDEQTIALNKSNAELLAQKEEIQLQYDTIKILAEMGQSITASVQAKNIIDKVYESVNKVMDAEDFTVGVVNKELEVLEFFGFENPYTRTEAQRLSLSDEDHLSVWCVKNSKTVFLSDVESEIGNYLGKKVDLYTNESSPKSLIYLPLINVNKETIGVLIAKSYRVGAYTQVHLNLLQNLASYISIALDNAAAYNKIELQSQKLQELDEIKTHFLTNITHEFQTPITLILGPVENLLSIDSDSQRVLYYKLIERNAKRLQKLIKQLLELSQIDEGVMHLSPTSVNVVALVQDTLTSFQYLAKTKNIRFEVDIPVEPIWCLMDAEKFEDILSNLVSNAIKYTEIKYLQPTKHLAEPAVKVQINKYVYDQKNQIEIRVSDNGIGIEPQNIDKIFDRFFRTKNHLALQTEGVGIGLALSKKIALLMQGDIRVESTPGVGSTFICQLPLTPTNAPTLALENQTGVWVEGERKNQASPDSDSTVIQKQKILIIDDNSDMRALISSSIRDSYEVYEAAEGIEGLKKAYEIMPDVIVSDVMMPKMDGMELCKQLKSDVRTDHIPILLLTAKATNTDRKEGYEVGADAYITKPFDRQVFVARIKNLIENREALIRKFRQFAKSEIPIAVKSVEMDPFLKNVVDIIENHISDTKLTVDSIVHKVGISRTLFFKKFQALAGMQPNDFLRTYRLNKAKQLFLQGTTDIAQVAYMVGFEYANYFTRCFKEEFGYTPTEYMKQIHIESEPV